MALKDANFTDSVASAGAAAGQYSLVEGININDTATKVVFNVLGSSRLSIQTTLKTGVYGSTVITLKQTLNGVDLVAFGTPITITADGITGGFDVTDHLQVVAEVTTASGGPATVDISSVRSSVIVPRDGEAAG